MNNLICKRKLPIGAEYKMDYGTLESIKAFLRLRHQILPYTEEEKLAIAKLLDELIQIKVRESAATDEDRVRRYSEPKVFE